MKEKVYCSKCRFYIEDDKCGHEKNIRYRNIPTKKITMYGNVYKINKKNKCKQYQLITSEEIII